MNMFHQLDNQTLENKIGCGNFLNKQKWGSLLEQSDPCLPTSQEHSPTKTSQLPAPLQSAGQVNSGMNKNKTILYQRNKKEALKYQFCNK